MNRKAHSYFQKEKGVVGFFNFWRGKIRREECLGDIFSGDVVREIEEDGRANLLWWNTSLEEALMTMEFSMWMTITSRKSRRPLWNP